MRTETRGSWATLPLAVQSFSLEDLPVNDVIKQAVRLGLRNIEFFHGHISPRSRQADVISLKKALNRAGVSIGAYGLHLFTSNHERNRRAFDFAILAGVKNITAEVEQDAFDSLQRLVSEYNVRVAIHTSGPGSRYEKIETLTKDLKGKHKMIGVCVDTGHILRAGGNPALWIRELGDRVFVLHLTDVAQPTAQTFSAVLGKGHLKLSDVLASLIHIGFPPDGCISIGYRGWSCARLMTPPGHPSDPLLAISDSLHELVG